MVNIILIIILFLILLVYLNFFKYNERFLNTADVRNQELLDIGTCIKNITNPKSWNKDGSFKESPLNKVAFSEDKAGQLNLTQCKQRIRKYWESIYLMKEICDKTENQDEFSDDLRKTVMTNLFDNKEANECQA